jgi:hypothetical protein
LSGRVLCDELITRPEESYRLWCVVVCDLETSWMRRPWPTGSCYTKKSIILKSDLKVQVGLKSHTLLEDIITFNCCRRRQFTQKKKWLPSNVIRLFGWPRKFIYFTGTRHGFTLYIRCLCCSFLKFQVWYSVLRRSGKDYIARTFMICTHQILSAWTNQDWNGRGV